MNESGSLKAEGGWPLKETVCVASDGRKQIKLTAQGWSAMLCGAFRRIPRP